ncbi:MAG TPA: GHMP kinase, partial [Candidatus Lokiarchaeia archaeon]|nr:GHMP kinase [Candidatus Lokiarchaeia archaeon]
MQVIQEYTNARIGILGNPSDGYFGATIAATIQNFAAHVILYEWPQIEILPGPADADKFSSISDLVQQIQASGYYGGTRLIKGTIKKFWDYLQKNHISLADSKKNFSIRYESTIPRQVGLAGSSAIIISTLKALCQFYDVTIPLPILPNIALSVEKEELGIQGGLQDRVAQVYGGLV